MLRRDIVKKKRDEHLKMVWRVAPAHKKLQTRMEHMRRFRRQHEQLRTVIVRVLRPSLLNTVVRVQESPAVEEGTVKAEHPISIDTADANAIEVSDGPACIVASYRHACIFTQHRQIYRDFNCKSLVIAFRSGNYVFMM